MFLVDQMKVMSALYWTVTHLSSIFSAISKKQVHRKTHYTDSKPISLCSFSLMPSAKQTSNNDLFFVIVCYPFEWKHMCGGFTLVFFYCIAVGNPSIKRERLASHSAAYPGNMLVPVPIHDLDFKISLKYLLNYLWFRIT